MEESLNTTKVPKRLAAEVTRLTGERPVLDQAIGWRRSHWDTSKLSQFQSHLDEIADASTPGDDGLRHIQRRHVFDLAGGDAVPLFLAAMVWGYGTIGYGPERVGEIARNAGADFAPKLERQREAALRGPSGSWTSFRSTDRLRGLGPAFASKFAYFAAFEQSDADVRPLIVDLNTSWAMWKLVKLPRSVELKGSYLDYVEVAHRWAADNNWRADEVEWALFEIGKTVDRKSTTE